MKIIAISDTHNKHEEIKNIPKGELIIHAGDVTEYGTEDELQDFILWFSKLPHKYKIFIAGNHDLCLEQNLSLINNLPQNMYYLQNSGVTIEGFNIWGTPTGFAIHGMAFSKNNKTDIENEYIKIPITTDILITHTPAKGILDNNYGCEILAKRINIVKPKLHVFGHNHMSYGEFVSSKTISVNASLVNEKGILEFEHKIINKPVIIDLK